MPPVLNMLLNKGHGKQPEVSTQARPIMPPTGDPRMDALSSLLASARMPKPKKVNKPVSQVPSASKNKEG